MPMEAPENVLAEWRKMLQPVIAAARIAEINPVDMAGIFARDARVLMSIVKPAEHAMRDFVVAQIEDAIKFTWNSANRPLYKVPMPTQAECDAVLSEKTCHHYRYDAWASTNAIRKYMKRVAKDIRCQLPNHKLILDGENNVYECVWDSVS